MNYPNLEEVKAMTIEQMKREHDIIGMIYELGNEDFMKYQEWYINHPYSKGIRDIQELVRTRPDCQS